jgi:hypothetical protein
MLQLAWDDLETGPRGLRWGTCIKWAKMHRMCMCMTESQMGRGSLLGTCKSKYRRNVDRASTMDCSTRPLLISGATVKFLRRAGLDLGILGADGGLRVAGR